MNTTFNSFHETAIKIPYDEKWWCIKHKDFNQCVTGIHAPKLQRGEVRSSEDAFGRKLVIVGTNNIDNIVLYERYARCKKQVIISNETFEFSKLVEVVTNADISNSLYDIDVLAIYETISRDMSVNILNLKNNTTAVHAWSI
jgi:hypothetical protein